MKNASSKAFWFPLWRLFAATLVIAVGTRSLVEFADKGVDGAGAHEDVEVGQHGNRKAESKKQKAKILAALAR